MTFLLLGRIKKIFLLIISWFGLVYLLTVCWSQVPGHRAFVMGGGIMSEQWILAALCLVTRWLNSFSVTILLLLFAFCFTLLFSHFFSSCFSFLFFLSWFLFIIPVLHFFFFLSSLCIYFASFYPQLSQTPGRCASRRLFHSQLRKKRQMQSLYQLFSLVS